MCGIAGFIDISRSSTHDDLELMVSKMAHACSHRGPDDGGVWVDHVSGIALGHRRLSILDLSPGGHQPMSSRDGQYVLVFNGEIYNYAQIREELNRLGEKFTSGSDTEVMLRSFVCWGVSTALKKFVGMFAFAFWDAKQKVLYLGRDRFGEKPLYYGIQDRTLFFASELKSLRAHPKFEPVIERNVLVPFLSYGYIPSPHSVYAGIRKLPPGTYLAVTSGDLRKSALPEPVVYWSLESIAIGGNRKSFTGSINDATDELDRLLKEAVKLQMVADVPVGAFLSGGIDSSTVVALMQAQSSKRVKTFTIGFQERSYDEAVHAKSVAQWLGTDHTEVTLTPQETLEVIPRLPQIYDEPFADSSQIPTYLVSTLARTQVKVSLSGDGGDELFCGYNRYIWATRIWNMLRMSSLSGERVARLVHSIPLAYWNSISNFLGPIVPPSLRHNKFGDKMHKLADVINTDSAKGLYQGLMHHWKRPLEVVRGASVGDTKHEETNGFRDWRSLYDFMMYTDSVTYLPDDILVKVDRASMAVSLESRIPLLDHRIAEFAWSLPQRFKIRGTRGKHVLRALLNRYVPARLMNRPKMGFGLPIGEWLRGPLRDWAESLLDTSLLNRQGFFDPAPIRKKWSEHLEGKRRWSSDLWIILMFQAWLESV